MLGQCVWRDDSWSSLLVQLQQRPPVPTCWLPAPLLYPSAFERGREQQAEPVWPL